MNQKKGNLFLDIITVIAGVYLIFSFLGIFVIIPYILAHKNYEIFGLFIFFIYLCLYIIYLRFGYYYIKNTLNLLFYPGVLIQLYYIITLLNNKIHIYFITVNVIIAVAYAFIYYKISKRIY